MYYIFHGDNQLASRSALNSFLDKKTGFDIFRVDAKEINLDNINGFINSQSLFSSQKIIVFLNFFSIPKAISDKLIKIIKSNSDFDIVIWQDKTITATQIKTFPKTTIEVFPLDKKLFNCLNNLYPKNLTKFIPLFHQVLEQEPFELLLFWLKLNLRKQLTGFSRFSPNSIKTAYLQTIELDYQSKTGQLVIPKEIALERILLNLLK
jgi:DNA polymerase III delta subunit